MDKKIQYVEKDNSYLNDVYSIGNNVTNKPFFNNYIDFNNELKIVNTHNNFKINKDKIKPLRGSRTNFAHPQNRSVNSNHGIGRMSINNKLRYLGSRLKNGSISELNVYNDYIYVNTFRNHISNKYVIYELNNIGVRGGEDTRSINKYVVKK